MRTRAVFLLWMLVLACTAAGRTLGDEKTAGRDWIWARGNIHAHSTESDGDVSPHDVASYYRQLGYQFLALTDHHKLVDPATIKAEGLVLIPGEEMETDIITTRRRTIHLNALGIRSTLKARPGSTVAEAVRENIEHIRAAGGLPMVNHPNYLYSIGYQDLLPIQGPYLLEIYNGGNASNAGDEAHISVEQMWDILLSAGRQVYGAAADDAHYYKSVDKNALQPNNPGRGWVAARVKALTPSDVLAALKQGEFYSSTGVVLDDVQFKDGSLTVTVRPEENVTHRIWFIGTHGRILYEADGPSATCKMPEDSESAYIRAKIISSDDRVAWTQAFRTE